MADDWEDWEDESFEPALPVVAGAQKAQDSFADEDEEEDSPKHVVETSKPKTKVTKKYTKGEASVDEPLDDPIAEKLRQQRLVEESDFQAAKELFGEDRTVDSFIPKTQKDFEEYSRMLVHKYILPYADSTHYKTLLKSVNKTALLTVTSQEAKDVETCLAGIRYDKMKQERDAVKEKKDAGKKKNLNFGARGTGKGADILGGVDEYLDDGALDVDDEYDFM